MNNSLSAIVSSYRSLKEQHNDLVLATLIEVQGSSYRRPGARMLINRQGQLYGLLGDAGLHSVISESANQVFTTKASLLLCYSPKNDDNIRLKVFLQYLARENDFQPLELISELLQNQGSDVMVTVYESEVEKIPSGTVFFASTTENKTSSLDEHLVDEILEICQDVSAKNITIACEHFLDNKSLSLFYSKISPPLSLLILGSGEDTRSVIHFAKQLGWYVTVADHSGFVSDTGRFPEADVIMEVGASSVALPETVKNVDAIIIMSHDKQRDKHFLSMSINSSAIYIGLLASEKRRDELLATIDAGMEKFKDRFFSPAGLTLGGDLPEEIGISLVAQIMKVASKRRTDATSTPVVGNRPAELEKLAVVVLAAGGSKRFGGVKQLLEYDGSSLLRRSANTAKSLFSQHAYIILGPKQLKMERELSRVDIEIIANPNWQSGISSSIKTGLRAIPAKCSAVLFMLCDQPLISSRNLQQLISQWHENQDKIICSQHSEICSEPVIVPRKYFPEISKLYKDQGLKQILDTHIEDCICVPIPETAFDVDTQDDYMRLLTETQT